MIFPRVGDKNVKVIFTAPALFGNVGKAEFTTTDKELIKAMKASPMFGVEYFVKNEIADEPIEATATAEPTKKEVDYRDLCDATKPIIEEESGVDVATANNWCQREHSTIFKGKRSDSIKNEAATTYNTIFPNWK